LKPPLSAAMTVMDPAIDGVSAFAYGKPPLFSYRGVTNFVGTMRLLVTGGMGFIGSNFIRRAVSNHTDLQIVNLDSLSYGSNPANLRDLESGRKYRFIKGNICDEELLKDTTKEVDAVVNFAAESHVDRSISKPQAFLDSNTLGVLTLLEACRKRDLRLLQVSTDEVYGSTPEGTPFRETDRLDPSSPYSASKASADMLVNAYHRTYGLWAVVTRSTNNYGPYQFPEKFIPKTIIRAYQGLQLPVYGSGKQIRDWIHVQDHCEALDLVLRRGRPGEVFNVAGGNQAENLEVVNRILTTMGKSESLITHVEDRPGHDLRYRLDASKIERELGWKPKRNFEEGLTNTVKWYLENESWWRPLIDERVLSPAPWKEKW
jgi:dTDP-glucose 4,6-dehydratase